VYASRFLPPTAFELAMTPANRGYAMPTIVATTSPAAAVIRAAEITSNPSSHEIPTKPRSW
jgi:hypothetical protein